MTRHGHSDRPASITDAPESPSDELGRRQRRYAVMAAIFIASFSASALLHRYTVVALLLAGVAVVTLILAVIGANIRSPRRYSGPARVVSEQRQLRSGPAKRSPGK